MVGIHVGDRIVKRGTGLSGNLSLERVIKSNRTNARIDNEAVGYEVVCLYNIPEQAAFVPIILFRQNISFLLSVAWTLKGKIIQEKPGTE
jgi:hypothetical protein